VDPKKAERLHLLVYLVVGFGLAMLLGAALLSSDPLVVLHVVVAALAMWFIASIKPQAQANHCPACGGVQDPVRNTDGARLWTCRACGHERARLRSRDELEVPAAVQPH
jgi:hypothetical protein